MLLRFNPVWKDYYVATKDIQFLISSFADACMNDNANTHNLPAHVIHDRATKNQFIAEQKIFNGKNSTFTCSIRKEGDFLSDEEISLLEIFDVLNKDVYILRLMYPKIKFTHLYPEHFRNSRQRLLEKNEAKKKEEEEKVKSSTVNIPVEIIIKEATITEEPIRKKKHEKSKKSNEDDIKNTTEDTSKEIKIVEAAKTILQFAEGSKHIEKLKEIEEDVKPLVIEKPKPEVIQKEDVKTEQEEPNVIVQKEDVKMEPIVVVEKEDVKMEPIIVIEKEDVKMEPVVETVAETKIIQKPKLDLSKKRKNISPMKANIKELEVVSSPKRGRPKKIKINESQKKNQEKVEIKTQENLNQDLANTTKNDVDVTHTIKNDTVKTKQNDTVNTKQNDTVKTKQNDAVKTKQNDIVQITQNDVVKTKEDNVTHTKQDDVAHAKKDDVVKNIDFSEFKFDGVLEDRNPENILTQEKIEVKFEDKTLYCTLACFAMCTTTRARTKNFVYGLFALLSHLSFPKNEYLGVWMRKSKTKRFSVHFAKQDVLLTTTQLMNIDDVGCYGTLKNGFLSQQMIDSFFANPLIRNNEFVKDGSDEYVLERIQNCLSPEQFEREHTRINNINKNKIIVVVKKQKQDKQ